MRYIFLVSILVLAVLTSSSQNKKAEKEEEAKKNYEKALVAIDIKDYVIIVDQYEAENGIIETNTDIANFFAFEKDYVILQGSMVVGSPNPNKMAFSDYKQEIDKKGSISIEMQLKGSMVTASVEIFMKKGGNYADVVLTTTKRGTKRFSGEIVPRSESKYFKRPGEI